MKQLSLQEDETLAEKVRKFLTFMIKPTVVTTNEMLCLMHGTLCQKDWIVWVMVYFFLFLKVVNTSTFLNFFKISS